MSRVHGKIVTEHADVVLGGASKAGLERWANVTDLVGCYLLLLPAAIVMWQTVRPTEPLLADLGLAGAAIYIVVGACGAAALAVVGSELIEQHSVARFALLADVVTKAMWQTVGAAGASIWWLTTGVALRRLNVRLGWLTLVLGAAVLLVSVGRMIDVEAVFAAGGAASLPLSLVWPLCVGLALVRRREPFASLTV